MPGAVFLEQAVGGDPALCLLCLSPPPPAPLASLPAAPGKRGAAPARPRASTPVGRGFDVQSIRFPGLELNGMTVTGVDTAEVPPPLPLKGCTADYGNLVETQDPAGSPVPPPPPPHQRVSPYLFPSAGSSAPS